MKSFSLLEYDAVQYVESQQKFRRKIFPPPSVSKNKSSSAWHLIQTGLFHGLFFHPEDGDDMFLLNVG
jgi:hypothetical protein